jgi:hypothetical protein
MRVCPVQAGFDAMKLTSLTVVEAHFMLFYLCGLRAAGDEDWSLAPASAAIRVITTRAGAQDRPIVHSPAHRNQPEAAPSHGWAAAGAASTRRRPSAHDGFLWAML